MGASRLSVVRATFFRRQLIQAELGIIAGAALIAVGCSSLATELPGMTDGLTLSGVAIILDFATVLLGVCLVACALPTRRALAGIRPSHFGWIRGGIGYQEITCGTRRKNKRAAATSYTNEEVLQTSTLFRTGTRSMPSESAI